MRLREFQEPQDSVKQELDEILTRCAELVLQNQEQDPEHYGMVGACVVGPDGRTVYRTSSLDEQGQWRHAERNAMEEYGDLEPECIIVTTLSPCNSPMNDRAGESCEDLIKDHGIEHVYCGYKDPTQDHSDAIETDNVKLRELCKRLSDTFLKEDGLSSITEIEALPSYIFTGSKDTLSRHPLAPLKQLRHLPGGTDLQYGVVRDQGDITVQIVDPGMAGVTKPQVVAALVLVEAELPNTLQVSTIAVDPDYRGRGLAKALYGIVLTIMHKNLLSGVSQTPGGRRNWMSLATIPGVEVKGLISLYNSELDPNQARPGSRREKRLEGNIDKIMELGGQFVGKDRQKTYWAFDVEPGRGQLRPVVQNRLSQLYGYASEAVLMATVTGNKIGMTENFADGKRKGKSRPGRVKKAGASCNGSVSDLRARAKKYGGERGRMYHWCANMKAGKKK
jgi:pyrimidine deaminase RibD-like protein/ribosomal protein S18 acetylase RimI-like enzyme